MSVFLKMGFSQSQTIFQTNQNHSKGLFHFLGSLFHKNIPTMKCHEVAKPIIHRFANFKADTPEKLLFLGQTILAPRHVAQLPKNREKIASELFKLHNSKVSIPFSTVAPQVDRTKKPSIQSFVSIFEQIKSSTQVSGLSEKKFSPERSLSAPSQSASHTPMVSESLNSQSHTPFANEDESSSSSFRSSLKSEKTHSKSKSLSSKSLSKEEERAIEAYEDQLELHAQDLAVDEKNLQETSSTSFLPKSILKTNFGNKKTVSFNQIDMNNRIIEKNINLKPLKTSKELPVDYGQSFKAPPEWTKEDIEIALSSWKAEAKQIDSQRKVVAQRGREKAMKIFQSMYLASSFIKNTQQSVKDRKWQKELMLALNNNDLARIEELTLEAKSTNS